MKYVKYFHIKLNLIHPYERMVEELLELGIKNPHGGVESIELEKCSFLDSRFSMVVEK